MNELVVEINYLGVVWKVDNDGINKTQEYSSVAFYRKLRSCCVKEIGNQTVKIQSQLLNEKF
jgi:hypothetical protein